MENREQQILSEIKSMMSSIRSQLELLDAKMAELQQAVDPEEFDAESVDLDIDLDETSEIAPVEEVTVQEIPLEEPLGTAAVEDDDDLPVAAGYEPEVKVIVPEPEVDAKPTVNEMLAANCAWRKDMPGARVKDVRSAISLNDRVIFINLLFDEDAQKFVNTLSEINSMDNLEQAVGYISEQFPAWDMNSDLVYRFMMAVRRKIQ